MLTNARSLSPKIHSLHTAFTEHDLDFALVTESWLKDSRILDRDVIDLEFGTNLKIVYKNRPRNPAGRRTVGGGVSIIYNKSKCNLKERKIRGNNFELVLAVGKVGKIPRQAAIFCLYLEPRMKVSELKDLCDLLSREILMLKASGNPAIFIGGDLNRKSLDDALADFPDIVQVNHDPTRGNACLDIMFSNVTGLTPSTWPPLETRDGVRSDHLCLVVSGKIEKERNFTWIKKTARKHTEAALVEYGARLRGMNWDELLPGHLDPDVLVSRFEEWNATTTDELFPLRTIRCRSNEDPWITDGIRKISGHKKRVYKREGKSRHWRILDDRMQRLLEDSKSTFVNNIEKSGANTRSYFKAVKQLGSVATGEDWSLPDLFPGSTPQQAAEEAATYFTRITDLFEPVEAIPLSPGGVREAVTLQEIEKRLKSAKKPNSVVAGDLLPRVVKAHHQLLAYPVMLIYNAVFRRGSWPSSWKTETTVVIPKVPTPESLADCRNISCTPFLSKVLEGILLDDLRSEIPADMMQYGGVRNSSVDHMLVDLFETVLEPLEHGRPSLVLGIDYEKAFNRLDHGKCLEQLRTLGASAPSLTLTSSFLASRNMRVRVGSHLSGQRRLCGGSPQGSILGCYLYGAATQRLDLSLPRNPEDPARTAPAPPDVEAQSPGDSDGFGLLDDQEGRSTDDASSDGSFLTAEGPPSSPHEAAPDPLLHPLEMFKYVDDTTVAENVEAEAVIRHVSASSPTEHVPAAGLSSFFSALIVAAAAIGMVVNCKKTQLVCFSPDNGYLSYAELFVQGAKICSQATMKLLGYMLGSAPGATDQVEQVKKKFRGRFWTLIHLRRAGITGHKLFKLYAALIRPVLETNCVIYHPMLTKCQTVELERLQKQVVRLCFGYEMPYHVACTTFNIDSLESRREKRIRRFTSKAMNNPRFADRWFVRREEIGTALRNRRPFIEKKPRTERYKKSPLLYLQKIANDLATNAIS